MEQPARVDINADRWVACIRYLSFIGIDLTGATFAVQVRQVPDAGGSPLANLSTTTSSSAEGVKLFYAGTDTLTAHIAAGRLEELPDAINPATGNQYAGGDSVALSWVRIRVNETTMESLPFPDEINQGDRGGSVLLAWDMHITPSGGTKDKYAGGNFLVRAGATE
jgi:hypothetical protein